MAFSRKFPPLLAVLAMVVGAGALGMAATGHSQSTPGPKFSNPGKIDNRYLPITTRRRCEHRGRDHDGTRTRSVQTVLTRRKRFTVYGQAVDAVVVRDQAFAGGKPIEVTLDYFAQSDDGTVYYLGERVNNLRKGKVVDHDGTWLLGRHTDVPGVAMPASPTTGTQYRFEDVPGITSESNRVEETGLRTRTRGRLRTGVIRISEFIQPEGETEQKLYAPGVGQIVEYPPDGRSQLVGCR